MGRPLIIAALLSLVAGLPLGAAETCGWLPTKEVDAALPKLAPWSVMAGGAGGSCKFVTTNGPASVFGANQMVKASPAEAAAFVGSLRKSMAETYTVAPATDLGAEGFTYRPRAGETSDRSIYLVGHQGRIAVIASLSLQKPVAAGDIEGAKRLAHAALAAGDDPKALAAMSDCPWFDAATLRKLLPGEGFSQQSFGDTSCLAQAGGKALILTVMSFQDLTAMARFETGGCHTEPVPALGPTGELAYRCSGGSPQARVTYVSGGKLVAFSFSPQREPTEAERALLVELAQRSVKGE